MTYRPPASEPYVRLAVFRLNDLCVSVQEGMDEYLSTAALQKMPAVEATFSWLRRRRVRICLLSDYGRQDTLLLLGRLGWTVDEQGTVQEVITYQRERDNPISLALEDTDLVTGQQSIAVVDTPRLLHCAREARTHLGVGICNGHSAYHELAAAPHHALLDSLLQLPNFLLEHLAVADRPIALLKEEGARSQVQRLLPRLRLNLPLNWG